MQAGPARSNPFSLAGGVGAVWLKDTEQPGTICLTATHSVLGAQTITVHALPSPLVLTLIIPIGRYVELRFGQ